MEDEEEKKKDEKKRNIQSTRTQAPIFNKPTNTTTKPISVPPIKKKKKVVQSTRTQAPVFNKPTTTTRPIHVPPVKKKKKVIQRAEIQAPIFDNMPIITEKPIYVPPVQKRRVIQSARTQAPIFNVNKEKELVKNDNDYTIGIKKPEALVVNKDIADREGLSNDDKEKLYPAMLDYLKDKKGRFNLTYMQELVFNDFAVYIIFSDAGIKDSDNKKEDAHEILKILFFALYKAEDKQELITNLKVTFLDMNRNEIDDLIEKIRTELNHFTGEELYKNWIDRKDFEQEYPYEQEEFEEKDYVDEEESEELIQESTENEELLSEDDNIIPEVTQNFETNEMETANTNISNFREKVKEHLEDIINLIDFMKDDKKLILSKSLTILYEFISGAGKSDTSILEKIDLRLFATTIIYTAVISNEAMPRISMAQISEIANVNTNTLGGYYRKYFKSIYSKAEFLLSEYKLGRIRNYISLYFFETLRSSEIKTSDLVLRLKNKVLRRENLPKGLTQKNIDTLYEIVTQFEDKFEKYFFDLVEIVRNLIISSIIHKKIGALLSLNPLAKYFREKNINLLQKGKFYNSIKGILDFLEEKNPNFFPKRWGDRKNLPEKEKVKRDREYRRIVGRKLKYYLLKKVYNGKYFQDSLIKCPECVKEGLNINTNSLRLKSLDCHHDSAEKENIFKSDNLYLLFNENRGNPNVLEYLINLLESEDIILLCRNHHRRLHFNDEFDYIVNFEDIFTFPSELIHLLVKVSLDSFRLTKNLNPNEKGSKKKNIIRKIKKKYIIVNYYGEYCHICEEFSIKKDLTAFDFHHKHEDPHNIKAHELYDTHSCSEIARILIDELGGYICTNCHTVIQYKLMHLLDDIYENKNIVKKIVEDYKFTQNKFTTMNEIKGVVIQDILEKSVMINETYERYLTAIYEISKIKSEITISDLVEYTGYDQGTIHRFFKKESDLLRQSIEIKIGGAPKPTVFILTEKGKEFISLIYHFKDYFSSI